MLSMNGLLCSVGIIKAGVPNYVVMQKYYVHGKRVRIYVVFNIELDLLEKCKGQNRRKHLNDSMMFD